MRFLETLLEFLKSKLKSSDDWSFWIWLKSTKRKTIAEIESRHEAIDRSSIEHNFVNQMTARDFRKPIPSDIIIFRYFDDGDEIDECPEHTPPQPLSHYGYRALRSSRHRT